MLDFGDHRSDIVKVPPFVKVPLSQTWRLQRAHREYSGRAAFGSVGKALAFGNERCLGARVRFPVGPNFSVALPKRCLPDILATKIRNYSLLDCV